MERPITTVIPPMGAYLKHAFRGWTVIDFLLLGAGIVTVIVGFAMAGR